MQNQDNPQRSSNTVVQLSTSIGGSSRIRARLTDANAKPPRTKPKAKRTNWWGRVKAAWLSTTSAIGTIEALKGLAEWVGGLFTIKRRGTKA